MCSPPTARSRAQEPGLETHDRLVHGLPGGAEELERERVVELDSDLRREPFGTRLDRRERLVRERLVAGQSVDEHRCQR
jgi:hypothetical protein